jgi:hypothetical protein
VAVAARNGKITVRITSLVVEGGDEAEGEVVSVDGEEAVTTMEEGDTRVLDTAVRITARVLTPSYLVVTRTMGTFTSLITTIRIRKNHRPRLQLSRQVAK